MKKTLVSFFVVVACCLFFGCGEESTSEGSSTPAAEINPYETKIFPYETKPIVAAEGGTLDVKGAVLEIPAGSLSKDATLTASEVINPSPLPQGANYIGKTYDFSPAVPLAGPCKLTIPYTDRQMFQAGGENAAAIKLYFYDKDAKAWSQAKVLSIDTCKKIVFGEVQKFGFYTLATLQSDIPKDLGTPRPGDILFAWTKYKETIRGWQPGIIAIYVGEKDWDGRNPDFATDEVKQFKKYNAILADKSLNVHRAYFKIANIVQETPVQTPFADPDAYMGAREVTTDQAKRKVIAAFADNQVGKKYVTVQAGSDPEFQSGERVEGPDEYNGAGLVQKACMEAGINGGFGLLSSEQNKAEITIAQLYSKTRPAGGVEILPIIKRAILAPNAASSQTTILVQISVEHAYGLSEIDSVYFIDDKGVIDPKLSLNDSGQDGDVYANDGVFTGKISSGEGQPGQQKQMTFIVVDKQGKTATVSLPFYFTTN